MEEMTQEQKEKAAMAAGKAKLGSIFRRGIWNSGLLAVMFASMTMNSVQAGSYLFVALGGFCTYCAVADALDFYHFNKMNNEVNSGETKKSA